MKRSDYPSQEPLSQAGEAYGAECWRRSEGHAGEEFAFGSDPYQRLLVFKPGRPNGATLLFWHGGGWTSGYKEWMAFMAPAFTSNGVTFVTAGYRVAPKHVFPAGLDDCLHALDWVKDNVGGDVFIGGHSAGAHYAALIAADKGATRVRGCLCISGCYEFGEGSGLSMRPRFLGGDAANDRAASVRFALTQPIAPFLVAYGTQDFAHLVAQASRFVQAVREAGGEAHDLPMQDRTHFTASFAGGEADGPWVPAALEFIRRNRSKP
jgi:acetyl esterase/lipase